MWLFTVMTTVLYLPFVFLHISSFEIFLKPATAIICMISLLFHLLYFICLDKVYCFGELSVIYPVARGVAPAMTVIGALLLLDERLTRPQLLSIALIIAGTFLLSGMKENMTKNHRKALGYALLCGCTVSAYTLIDKTAVATFFIAPFILDFVNNVGRTLVLMPVVLKDVTRLKDTARCYWKEAMIVGILSPFSYLMILFAMRHIPVSIVAPLRQFSIVISYMLGIHMLFEHRDYKKLLAIALMFCGVILISI